MPTYRVTEEDGSVYDITEEDDVPTDFLGGDASPEVAAGRSMIGGLSKLIPFGVGDEVIAGGTALSEQLPEFLGGTGRSLGEAYDSRLQEVRNYQKGFEEASGDSGANAVTEIGGGLLMPLGMLGRAASTAKGLGPAALNIGKASLVGGGLGYGYGFGSGEGLEDRLDKADTGATIGALTGGLLGGASEAAQGVANRLPKALQSAGEAMDRFSVGATKGSYAKSAQNISPWDFAQGEAPASATKKALDSVLKSGILGKTRDPEGMVQIASAKVRDLTDELETTLIAADESGMKIMPKFSESLNLIKSGKAVPADEVPAAIQKIETLKNAIAEQGGGKATYLQAQKQVFGEKWQAGDPLDRAIYRDLKGALEHTVKGVKDINAKIQEWKLVDPILRGGLSKKEGRDIIGNVYNYIRTSGAKTIAGPAVAGAAIGGKFGGPIGAVLGTGLGVASSPQGNRMIGTSLMKTASTIQKTADATRSVASKAGKIGITPGSVGKALGVGAVTVGVGNEKKESAPPETPRGRMAPPAPLSEKKTLTLDRLTKSVMKAESNGDPKALSPKGAIGLMQVMPKTGKEMARKLGIEYQPNNPKQNVLLGKAYLLEQLERFKDLPLALAAYNAGPSQVAHLVKKYGNSFEAIKDKLAKPEETVPYVRKIMKDLEEA